MPKTALPDWIDLLRKQYRVVGPKPLHGQHIFGEIDHADDLDLDYPNTVLPPKKYLVPTREVLLSYRLDGTHFEVHASPPPTVVLGIHTCDLHAIELFDRIFSQSYVDQHYQKHRENTLLVSYECFEPCTEHSFCRSMGTLSATDIADLHMIDLGDEYAFEIGSERGADLLAGLTSVFNATDEDDRRVNDKLHDKWRRFPYRLDLDVTELPSLLSRSFNSELWGELGAICLGCGMCTQVCPTCYCFDVRDEANLTLTEGQRIRTWDSCQINVFAMVAGGHNFRESQAQRQRHRFMRKGKYQADAYGLVGCVGCGRCAEACLVHITPVNTFNELYRREQVKQTRAGQEVT